MGTNGDDLGALSQNASLTDYSLAKNSTQDEGKLNRARQRQAEANAWLAGRTVPLTSLPDENSRFSVKTLLMMMTIAALVFAIGRQLTPAVFAGVCGLLTLVYPLIIMAFARDSLYSPQLRQIWWLLLAIYLISITIAMSHDHGWIRSRAPVTTPTASTSAR